MGVGAVDLPLADVGDVHEEVAREREHRDEAALVVHPHQDQRVATARVAELGPRVRPDHQHVDGLPRQHRARRPPRGLGLGGVRRRRLEGVVEVDVAADRDRNGQADDAPDGPAHDRQPQAAPAWDPPVAGLGVGRLDPSLGSSDAGARVAGRGPASHAGHRAGELDERPPVTGQASRSRRTPPARGGRPRAARTRRRARRPRGRRPRRRRRPAPPRRSTAPGGPRPRAAPAPWGGRRARPPAGARSGPRPPPAGRASGSGRGRPRATGPGGSARRRPSGRRRAPC